MTVQVAPRRVLNKLSLPKQRWGLLFAAGLLVVIALAAIFAKFVAPYPPTAVDLLQVNAGPSLQHLLGTDALGRDILTRLIYGAQTALAGPAIVVAISTALGLALGVWAGWAGGRVDTVLSRVFDIVLAFPALLLAILAVALFGKGFVAPVLAMAIAYTPYIARITRQLVTSEKGRQYVAAYRVQGFSGPWIAIRGVTPSTLNIVGAQATQSFGYVLVELAALSFLGLGIQAPRSDWGNMINEGQAALTSGNFLPSFAPAVAVVIVVVAVNTVGTWLAERLGAPAK